jgi:valyl-tRNA synthetase
MVSSLAEVVQNATRAFDSYDYAQALQITEEQFWHFCDHYVELVKGRSYSENDTAGRESAHAALYWCLKTFVKLLAPFVPFVTEEIWSWRFAGAGKEALVHTAPWPDAAQVAHIVGEPASFQAAVEVVSAIRGTKTAAQKGQRWGVASLTVKGTQTDLELLTKVLDDVIRAGSVVEGGTKLIASEPGEGPRFNVDVVLADA